MPREDQIKYVSVSVSSEARDALRRMRRSLSAAVGRELTLSDVAIAAAAIADRHLGQFTAEIRAGGSE